MSDLLGFCFCFCFSPQLSDLLVDAVSLLCKVFRVSNGLKKERFRYVVPCSCRRWSVVKAVFCPRDTQSWNPSPIMEQYSDYHRAVRIESRTILAWRCPLLNFFLTVKYCVLHETPTFHVNGSWDLGTTMKTSTVTL